MAEKVHILAVKLSAAHGAMNCYLVPSRSKVGTTIAIDGKPNSLRQSVTMIVKRAIAQSYALSEIGNVRKIPSRDVRNGTFCYSA